METYVHLWYFAEFFLEWGIFQAKVSKKSQTCVFCSVTLSCKLCPFPDNVEKRCLSRAGHTWQYNMAHALGMLDKYYKQWLLSTREVNQFKTLPSLCKVGDFSFKYSTFSSLFFWSTLLHLSVGLSGSVYPSKGISLCRSKFRISQ